MSKKAFAPLMAFAIIMLVGIGVVTTSYVMTNYGGLVPLPQGQLKQFSSCEQIKTFISESSGSGSQYYGGIMGMNMRTMDSIAPMAAGAEKQTVSESGSADYSTTNIQVAGVDEADIVKNDGKYIYTVSGQSIFIIDAYPAEGARILSQINSSGIREIFLNGDRLIVFGSEYDTYTKDVPVMEKMGIAAPDYYPRYYSTPRTYIHVYDIADRSNPVLKRNVSIEGDYYNSRMIGDYVYLIANKNSYSYTPGDPVPLPLVYADGRERAACGCSELYYFDMPYYSYQFTTIASINVKEDSGDPESMVIMSDYTSNMYVSQNNIYLSYMKRISWSDQNYRIMAAVKSALPAGVALKMSEVQSANLSPSEKAQREGEILQDYYNTLSESEKNELATKVQDATQKAYEEMAKETEKTVIHKIGVDNGRIEYKGKGEVSGHLLNQFSMDEKDGFLRVATTTSGSWSWRTGQQTTPSKNHVYVLDAGLSIAGKLEDLAPGESIYSARFIGDRAYLVTFKKIDPLFVIDLSDPANPSLLGKLKIPGYSDYLHPYDENHIIGIGKEATEAKEGDFAWYQGVKLALFDVTDPSNPKEMSNYVIGDRGTDSYALQDHKAFLFNRERNLLVIPVLLAEIDESKYPAGMESSAYGEYTFQGAYVFNLDLQNGFTLKGRITHADNETLLKSGYYWYSDMSVQRSLYIGENLYTISQGMVKANSLNDLSELASIRLPVEQPPYMLFDNIASSSGGMV